MYLLSLLFQPYEHTVEGFEFLPQVLLRIYGRFRPCYVLSLLFQPYEHTVEGFEFLPQVFVDQMEGKTQGTKYSLIINSSFYRFTQGEWWTILYMRAYTFRKNW